MRVHPATLIVPLLLGAACGDRSANAVPSTATSRDTAAARSDTPTPPSAPGDPSSARLVVRIEALPADSSQLSPGSLVVLADSSTLRIPIHDAQLVYALPAAPGAHWLLLRGYGCTACDAPELVWAVRTQPDAITMRHPSFPFPGAWLYADADTEDEGKPYFRSRMFVGGCLDEADPVAVWLEETLEPDTARSHVIRVLRGTPRLQDSTFLWSAEMQGRLEERTRAGACREVPPRDQIIL